MLNGQNAEQNPNHMTVGDGNPYRTVDIFVDSERVYLHVPEAVSSIDHFSAQRIVDFLTDRIRHQNDTKQRSAFYNAIIASGS